MSNSKSSRLSLVFDQTNPFEIDKCKLKNGDFASDGLALLNYSLGG